tara:strand:- start:545 stop:793 length:249 start_codon:yes stop_codon:yes gene_type:complete
MTKDKAVLGALRMQLIHYYKKGLGEKSEYSKNTIITPRLVKDTFNRYLELGGDLDFMSEFNLDEYNRFIDEIRAEVEEIKAC